MQTNQKNAAAHPFDVPADVVTFEQFLANVYHPDNLDIFRKKKTVDPDDLRAEFVIALHRIKFPPNLPPERANHLLRKLGARFVSLRLGDRARRAATHEAEPAKRAVAECFARSAPAPKLDAGPLAQLFKALRPHPSEYTEALTLAVRNASDTARRRPSLAEAQSEMPPRRFRECLHAVRQLAEAKGILPPVYAVNR